MKIECGKEYLLEALSVTEKITGTNPTLPILQCVLLSVRNNSLIIRSTNLELGIEVTIPVKVEEEGEIAVPASVFFNTLQHTSLDTEILLESTDTNLIIKTKHSNTVINAYTTEDFPSIPIVQNKIHYIFKTKELLEGIQSVVYSASNSTIKPELSSVYMYEYEKKIYFVATDSFRLAEKTIINKQKTSFEPILIPLRNASEIIRVLNQVERDTDVVVKVCDTQLSLKLGNVFITSRLIDGVFPDYKQIIPKETATEVIVLKQDLLNIFKKMNIFSDRFGQVTFEVEKKNKKFAVSAHNTTTGETHDIIDATIQGNDLDMRFNYRYIFDCLSSIHSDSVSLSFTGIGKPLIVRGVSDDSFLYLVMPMNK